MRPGPHKSDGTGPVLLSAEQNEVVFKAVGVLIDLAEAQPDSDDREAALKALDAICDVFGDATEDMVAD